MDLSIIIVNWNTCGITCDCLESIYAQSHELSFEVIVIDNDSQDESVAEIKRKFPQVKLIENAENVGFAGANNQGMEVASGHYLLLLNSDTLVLDNALDKVHEFALGSSEAGVIGCRVLNADRSLQPTCFKFPSLLNLLLFVAYLYKWFPRNRFLGREAMGWWERDDVREVDVVTGCFMWIPREVYETVGGMDERFFMYSEEVDWCWRIKKAGWRCLFTPTAEIIHLGGASAVKFGARRALIKDRSTVRYMFKNWPKWKAIVGVMLMQVFYVTRLFVVLPLTLCHVRYRIMAKNHLTGLWGLTHFWDHLKDGNKC